MTRTSSHFEDRAADTWEPRVAVADAAGGRWPATARAALLGLVDGDQDPANVSLRVRLLIDCRTAFGDADSLPTARLLDRLRADDEAPCATLGGSGLTARGLSTAGLRRAELCGLRWADIEPDWTGAMIRQTVVDLTRRQAGPDDLICPLCGAEHVGRHFKRAKTREGRRWVPLASLAQRALRQHQAAQLDERADFGADYQDHGLMFCQVDGLPLRPDSVTRDFVVKAAACDLPPIRLHDMRHGACSLMLAGGVPVEIMQMILGRSSPAVPRQVYAHLMRKATKARVEAALATVAERAREQWLAIYWFSQSGPRRVTVADQVLKLRPG